MAWSLFTFNVELKPLVAAVKELTSTGTRMADILERRYPAPHDRSKNKPAGPEAFTVTTEADRMQAIYLRRQKQMLGRAGNPDIEE